MTPLIPVVMDDRERSGPLPALLAQAGVFDIEVRRLAAGDYLVDGRLLFERKTLPDLALSIKDGRLFSQALRLATSPLRTALIIEGTARDIEGSGMRWEAVQGALVTVALFIGLPLLRCRTPAETVRTLEFAALQGRTVASGALVRRGRRPRGKAAVQQHLLQGLPGVGPERAARLLERFGSVQAVLTADAAALEAVPGIGARTARRVRWAVEEDRAGYAVSLAPNILARHSAGVSTSTPACLGKWRMLPVTMAQPAWRASAMKGASSGSGRRRTAIGSGRANRPRPVMSASRSSTQSVGKSNRGRRSTASYSASTAGLTTGARLPQRISSINRAGVPFGAISAETSTLVSTTACTGGPSFLAGQRDFGVYFLLGHFVEPAICCVLLHFSNRGREALCADGAQRLFHLPRLGMYQQRKRLAVARDDHFLAGFQLFPHLGRFGPEFSDGDEIHGTLQYTVMCIIVVNIVPGWQPRGCHEHSA